MLIVTLSHEQLLQVCYLILASRILFLPASALQNDNCEQVLIQAHLYMRDHCGSDLRYD